jgi:hypothetical protein
LEAPPSALLNAIALWVSSADRTAPLLEWSSSLPPEVEHGPIPSQTEADAWAYSHTLGLIDQFPVAISELTRLVLASALATKVSWQEPLEVVPATGHVRDSSPWAGRVQNVLLDRSPIVPPMLAMTEAAGVVAVHFAVATEDLAVLSLAADPSLDRGVVFEAAYEIAQRCRHDELKGARCSLFDLSLGDGHSWEITERAVPSQSAGEHSERIESVALAAWSVKGELDLLTGGFGIEPAVDALLSLIGPNPGDVIEAKQSAVASYTPTGFAAAAVTAIAIARAGISPQVEMGLERGARVVFDHPYAAIALAGTTSDFKRSRAGRAEMFCLPLISVWVDDPGEPEMGAADAPTPSQWPDSQTTHPLQPPIEHPQSKSRGPRPKRWWRRD